jgi:hypothetical protein
MTSIKRYLLGVAPLGARRAANRPAGDLALRLRTAAHLLALDGDESPAAETLVAAKRIDAALPTAEMRERFRMADPVRLLGRLVASRDRD